MRYRKLGSSTLEVSVLGLGCSNFGRSVDEEGTGSVVAAALECGVTYFDTADCYGKHFSSRRDAGDEGTSETLLGRTLRAQGVDRSQVVIGTKFGAPRHDMGFGPEAGAKGSRAYIRRAVESSLRRLQTDYIDLYQIHFPDPETPIAETLAALSELRDEGKVRHFGNSNFSADQIRDAQRASAGAGSEGFVSAQYPWSLVDRGGEPDQIGVAHAEGLSVIAYFPLAQGLLTGKIRQGEDPPTGTRIAKARHLIDPSRVRTMEALRTWADAHDRSLLEVALGWLAAQPACAMVIPGASSAAQLRANAEAIGYEPTEQEQREIEDLAR
jgi:aryl-alcohol dehydrogenase-like predicted oxidoreductase